MSRRPWARGLPLLFCLLLSGCAAYRDRPLDEAGLHRELVVPETAVLSRAGAHLAHPRLRPLRLDFSQPFSEEALGILAVLVNPDLKALRAKQQVADAQVFAAGLLPDPKLSARFDFIFSGPASLVNPYGAALSWDMAKLATRDTDRRIAQRQAERVRYDIAWQEWLTANQVRLLARRWVGLSSQGKVADQAAAIAGRLLELTRQNLEKGDAKLTDLGVRQAAFLDAQDRALALARQIQKTRQDLNRWLGLPPGRTLPIAESAPPPLAEADPAPLFQRAECGRLDLLALRAGYASQDAAVYRTILGQFPAFTLGLNDNRSYSDYTTGGPSLTVDLPLFNRNRGSIAIAQATREQLYREYVARLHQTGADIATLTTDLARIANEQAPLARELPELAHAEAELRRAAEDGDVTLLHYETVRANYLDKQLKLLALQQAAAEQAVALQITVGLPLLPSPAHE